MSSDEEDDFEEDEVVLVAVEMGTELDETEEWPPPEDGPPRVNPSRVNPSGPPGGPLCSQVIEGGAYGCLLLAGHAGEHQLSADGKRKSKVPERLELEVPRRHSKKRSIIANAVTTVAPSADTVLAADGKLRAECDSATIDKKLGPGSAAAGWKVAEQYEGGRSQGKWFYYAPDGTRYKSASDAAMHVTGGGASASAANAARSGAPLGSAAVLGGAGGGSAGIANGGRERGGSSSTAARPPPAFSAPLPRASGSVSATETQLRRRLEAAEASATHWEGRAREYHAALVETHRAGRALWPIAQSQVNDAGGSIRIPSPLEPSRIDALPDYP